ncbi:MAG: hypothetical protein GQ535_14590 [Rhodobacteraceae bacterium]|nr:hypothetical protein [Paracoccaceae bacterium]
MRFGKPFVATIMSSLLMAEMAFAQSSGAAAGGVNRPEIVFEAPKLADRQTVQDLLTELVADGFTYIEVHRTFLGRARFVAYTATEIREVVINPASGEILRDLVQDNTGSLPEQASANAQQAGNNGNGKGNNGNGNGNSGNGNSGNGNNGNGNGNSGN